MADNKKSRGDKQVDPSVTESAKRADEIRATNISQESSLAIKNAVQYETKENHGDDAFVHTTISVSLIELPRKKGEGPEAQTAFVMVKMTDPVASETAVKMLEEAASRILFQRDQ